MKKLVSVLLVFVMVFSFAPLFVYSAEAAVVLENGKFVAIAKNGYYKITAPGEGYIVATLKCTGTKSNSSANARFHFLNAKKKSFTHYAIDADLYVYKYGTGSESETTGRIPVSKGTYYVQIENRSADKGGSVLVKYTFTSIKQPANYTNTKALALKKGVATGIYQTPANNYNRWFKITLTVNAKVTFSGTNLSRYDINMYDNEGNEIEISDQFQSTKLPKGTYYVMIPTKTQAFGKAVYSTLKWK